MSRKVKPARNASKKPSAPKGGRIHLKVRAIHPAMQEFKRRFPQGTPWELVKRTRASESFCEKVLRGEQQPGEPMITALLQSDVGREILIALMGEAKPAWWKGFRRHLELAALVKNQAQVRETIERMQREMAE